MPSVDTFRPEQGKLVARTDIPARYKWDLTAICRDWDEWNTSYQQLDQLIDRFIAFQGTLARGADTLLAAFRSMDEMGALSYRV